MSTLQVYVSDNCWSCEETQRILVDVAPQFPNVTVELLNTAETALPEVVFAVPTYVLNGRVLFLGNPTREELCGKLIEMQRVNGFRQAE